MEPSAPSTEEGKCTTSSSGLEMGRVNAPGRACLRCALAQRISLGLLGVPISGDYNFNLGTNTPAVL